MRNKVDGTKNIKEVMILWKPDHFFFNNYLIKGTQYQGFGKTPRGNQSSRMSRNRPQTIFIIHQISPWANPK